MIQIIEISKEFSKFWHGKEKLFEDEINENLKELKGKFIDLKFANQKIKEFGEEPNKKIIEDLICYIIYETEEETK